jgi:DNA-binding NtrC family response regulator
VIIISGISDQEHALGLIKLGAFDFLLKPFKLEVVEKSVKSAVEFRMHLLEGVSSKEESRNDTNIREPSDWSIVKDESR